MDSIIKKKIEATMKSTTTSHHNNERNDWVCDVCDRTTDHCICQCVNCPNLGSDEHTFQCPICDGEGICFPSSPEEIARGPGVYYVRDGKIRMFRGSDFTEAYIACLIWADCNVNVTMDHEEHMVFAGEKIDEDCLREMVRDCIQFQIENKNDIASDPAQAGHDFWLDRNGHGAGSLDGHWPEGVGNRLADSAKKLGSCYVDSDGHNQGRMIHICRG